MLFDMADGVAGDLRGYLQQGWVKNQRLQDLQAIQLPIGPAAVGFGQVAIGGSPAQAMFAVVGGPGNEVYRFIFADSRGLGRDDVAAFDASLRSFRRLSASEAAAIVPLRVRVVRAGWRPGRDLRRRCRGVPDPRGLFVLLNGLDRGRTPRPGDRVKVISRRSVRAAERWSSITASYRLNIAGSSCGPAICRMRANAAASFRGLR